MMHPKSPRSYLSIIAHPLDFTSFLVEIAECFELVHFHSVMELFDWWVAF